MYPKINFAFCFLELEMIVEKIRLSFFFLNFVFEEKSFQANIIDSMPHMEQACFHHYVFLLSSPPSSCWINSNAVFYITVVGYFCVIFLLNISMFIVVLVQLCRIKRKKQLGAQRKTSIQDLRSIAGLTFLLGITWGFAFFAWGPVNVTFMYLFAIFNTLQGKHYNFKYERQEPSEKSKNQYLF